MMNSWLLAQVSTWLESTDQELHHATRNGLVGQHMTWQPAWQMQWMTQGMAVAGVSKGKEMGLGD
jgi:hypothetical protein